MSDLVLVSTAAGVRTLTLNLPRRLNGWTFPMMEALFGALDSAAAEHDVGAVVITGTGDYYSAGVNLSSAFQLGHPRVLREAIRAHNQELFDRFLDFPKPLLIAVNGHAIGAPVTSATLCDAIVAAEGVTFSTPFARLGVCPEGCSSEHFARLMGDEAAERMLGPEGWRPTATEALAAGLIDEVVPRDTLAERAQALAASWVAEGRVRTFRGGAQREQLKAVNAQESELLADAFLASPFLMGQFRFLWSRRKRGPALTFLALRATRPAWSLLL